MGEQFLELLRKERAKHDDRRTDPGLPEGDPLVDREHGDARYALTQQGLGGLDLSMAVGVGFDDRHDFAAGTQHPPKMGQVVGQCSEVDGGASWEKCRSSRHARGQDGSLSLRLP